MNIRKGMTVAKTGPAPDNFPDLKRCLVTLEVKEYESLNQAKKANGLNARLLQRGEKLPPTVSEANSQLAAVV